MQVYESEYDLFMNVTVWKGILEDFCNRKHSQYGIVAIVRGIMIVGNKEIWKSFLNFSSFVIKKDKAKCKNKELQAEAGLNKNSLASTQEQCVGLIGEEFTKKWEDLPPDLQIFLTGMSKEEFNLHQ